MSHDFTNSSGLDIIAENYNLLLASNHIKCQNANLSQSVIENSPYRALESLIQNLIALFYQTDPICVWKMSCV